MMTPAQRHLLLATCERAAELWADGNETDADRWAALAFGFVERAGDFVDDEAEEAER